MFDSRAKEAFEKLNLTYPAVAVKFCRNRPKGFPQVEGSDKLCLYLLKCQKENTAFCVAAENECCMGSYALGFRPLDDFHGSGEVGFRTGAFRTAAANSHLYYEAPTLKTGVTNFVVFCPVSKCSFDPDLIVCVTETSTAQVLLRASSYRSGDIWESKCSYVMSCAWTYAYPYLSGKVNHLFTGMHLGLKMFGDYPAGLHIISIPYQKIDEMVDSLYEMGWDSGNSEDAMRKVFETMDLMKSDINYPMDI